MRSTGVEAARKVDKLFERGPKSRRNRGLGPAPMEPHNPIYAGHDPEYFGHVLRYAICGGTREGPPEGQLHSEPGGTLLVPRDAEAKGPGVRRERQR